MLKSPLCDLLGIEKPVFQGGMAWIADASLASAVSEAGGLGIIAIAHILIRKALFSTIYIIK